MQWIVYLLILHANLITLERIDIFRRSLPENKIIAELLTDDGQFPNNPSLPLLLYKGVFDLSEESPALVIEGLFKKNGWGGMWRNGIYDFHHYHSTAHEVLGVCSGWADIQLGGQSGIKVRLEKKDVILIPAGVAHNNLGQSSDFRVVGAYPHGQHWDMNYGNPGERPGADHNIAEVPLPEKDPVYGHSGPVIDYWVNK